MWNEKKARGLSLKEPMKIAIPENLRDFAKDLQVNAQHSQRVNFPSQKDRM